MLSPVESQTAPEIIARLVTARERAPEGILAFDGDGTLWAGDVGEDFFHAMVTTRAVREEAAVVLRALAAEHGLASEGLEGSDVAAQIMASYVAGTFPEELAFELTSWLAAGHAAADARAIVRRALTAAGLAERFHPECAEVLAWARSAGVEVFIVSASPRDVVEEAAALCGIDAAHVVATTAARDARGVILASCERPIPYAAGKPAALHRTTGGRPLLGAFGDNAFDLLLLAEAAVPVAVRPKPRLRDRADEVAGLFELAVVERAPT